MDPFCGPKTGPAKSFPIKFLIRTPDAGPKFAGPKLVPRFSETEPKMVASFAETGAKTGARFCTKSVANFAYNWSTIWPGLEPKLATYFAQKWS